MTFDRERNTTETRAKSADEKLDLALQAAADAEEQDDGAAEDASFESFLERFPPAARDRRRPD